MSLPVLHRHFCQFILAVGLIFTFFLIGCGHRHSEAILSEVDSLMFVSPDSALHRLAIIDSAALNDADYAFMLLLSTKLRTKSYRDISSDTLIRKSVDYYRRSGDSLEWQSLFYYAEVLGARGDFIGTMMPSVTGYELAQKAGDDFYAGMLARRLCQSYYALTNPEMSQKWGETARNHFCRSGHKPHVAYLLINLCNALFLKGDFQGVVDKAAEADSAFLASDPDFCKNLNNCVFSALHSLGRYSEAIDCFSQYIAASRKASNKLVQSNKWSELADIYLDIGDITAAKVARDSASKLLKTQIDSLYLNFIDARLAKSQGDYEEASSIFERWGLDYSDELERRLKSPHNALMTCYLEEMVSEERISSRSKSRVIVLLVIISFLVIVATCLLIINYRSRMRLRSAENDALIGRIKSLEDDMCANTAKLVSVEIIGFFTHRFSELNRLCELYYGSSQGKPGEQVKKILSEVHSIIQDTVSDKSFCELEDTINRCDNNWMARFRADIPNLSEMIYRLAILTYCGFSARSLSVLLDKSGPNAIYQSKYRLKKAIMESESPQAAAYITRLGL